MSLLKRLTLILLSIILTFTLTTPAVAKSSRSPKSRRSSATSNKTSTKKSATSKSTKAAKSASSSKPSKLPPGSIRASRRVKGSTGSPYRSYKAKSGFLKSKGLTSVPKGMQVHHVIPVSRGGADKPSNMVLIPTSLHKQITKQQWQNGTLTR